MASCESTPHLSVTMKDSCCLDPCFLPLSSSCQLGLHFVRLTLGRICSEFSLLQRTSVVTLSICGIFKEVVTISAAGIVFHDELSAVNVSGLLVTIACIACYNYLKVSNMREEARKKLEKRDDDSGMLFPQPRQDEVGDREDTRPLMNGDLEGRDSNKRKKDESPRTLVKGTDDGIASGSGSLR